VELAQILLDTSLSGCVGSNDSSSSYSKTLNKTTFSFSFVKITLNSHLTQYDVSSEATLGVQSVRG